MGGRECRSHAAKKSRDGVSGLLGEGVLWTAAGSQGAQDPCPERAEEDGGPHPEQIRQNLERTALSDGGGVGVPGSGQERRWDAATCWLLGSHSG